MNGVKILLYENDPKARVEKTRRRRPDRATIGFLAALPWWLFLFFVGASNIVTTIPSCESFTAPTSYATRHYPTSPSSNNFDQLPYLYSRDTLVSRTHQSTTTSLYGSNRGQKRQKHANNRDQKSSNNNDEMMEGLGLPFFPNSNTTNPSSNTITAAAATAKSSFSSLFRRTIEFPTTFDFSAFIKDLQDQQQAYLQKHQIVKKRRVLKRMVEIITILSGQILRPLVCSALEQRPNITNLHIPTDQDWDAFWSYRKKHDGLTNAERVAKGIPQLGPTFVKLGQVVSTRPDILQGPLAEALSQLQDDIAPFDNLTAKRIIRRDLKKILKNQENKKQQIPSQGKHVLTSTSDDKNIHHQPQQQNYIKSKEDLQTFMDSLSEKPIAAASIAQVYKGYLPGYGPVAVKVKRPGISKKVERDATLFHSLATLIESSLYWKPPSWWGWWNNNKDKTNNPKQQKRQEPFFILGEEKASIIAAALLPSTVDEFTARVLEDMDFQREAANMKAFAKLYDSRTGSSPTVKVVVPELLLSSDRILVMEWLEGTKLTDVCSDRDDDRKENLALLKQAIEITISQMIDHGVMHGEPHSANLLKIRNQQTGKAELGYLDFGLVSYIPKEIRDGIVCAIVQIVFARNMEAVADLCCDLGLVPKERLELNPAERSRFVNALKETLDAILIWPERKKLSGRATEVPKIRFDMLLPALSKLVQGFDFTIPPYFLNNIRAIATLEGIALKLDPDFNILQVIYPYSINRMMRNPSVSKPVQETFLNICRSPETKLISPRRASLLLNDWALLTGYRKRKIFWDLFISSGGRRVTPVILHNWMLNRIRSVKRFCSMIQRLVEKAFRRVLMRRTFRQRSRSTTSKKMLAVAN